MTANKVCCALIVTIASMGTARASLIQTIDWNENPTLDFSGQVVLEFDAATGDQTNLVSCLATGVVNGIAYDWGQCSTGGALWTYSISPEDWSLTIVATSPTNPTLSWPIVGIAPLPVASLGCSGIVSTIPLECLSLVFDDIRGTPGLAFASGLSFQPVKTPEPATLALLLAGAFGMALRSRNKHG